MQLHTTEHQTLSTRCQHFAIIEHDDHSTGQWSAAAIRTCCKSLSVTRVKALNHQTWFSHTRATANIRHLKSVQATLLLGTWQATTTIISHVENNQASFSSTPWHLTLGRVAVRWWHWSVDHVDIWVGLVHCRVLVFLFSTAPCYKLPRVLTRLN